MEQKESVYSMYTRFTDIVNTLGALGKTFLNSEKVKKIIRSLPKEWRPKRTAIEEAKDLNVLPIDDLIGSLISYEEDLAAERGNEEKKKSIALKALKHESDEESELDEEEMDMLAKRLRKLFKKSGERRKFRDLKNRKEKKEVIKCYEYKKPGHIRTECPILNKLKKRAMVATWDDSDEETSDDEEHQEMTNLALMAIGDESDDELDEVNDLSTYDELYDAFKELHDNWIKIGKKNACLKKKMVKLTNENESLSTKITCLELENKTLHDRVALSNEKPSTSYEHLESYVDDLKNQKDALQKCNDSLNEKIKGLELDNKMLHDRIASFKCKQSTSYEHEKSHVDELMKENEVLKKKSNELNQIVLKFTNGQKMLDNLLNSQKCVFDKGGCVGFCGGLQCRGTAWRQLFVFDLRAELGCTWCYRVRVCVVALGNWQLGIRILHKVRTVAYKLQLSEGAKFHLVFHVSLLKKAMGESTTTTVELPPIDDEGVIMLQSESIVDTHWLKRGGKLIEQSLVHWNKLPPEEATWEDATLIRQNFPSLALEDKGPLPEGGIDKPRRSTRTLRPTSKFGDCV
ncbi:hypothetical protein KPL71_001066 [Citrus sinensis]|uniref:Uncharacterized protein n=1 Tax=Citrus sinensis TaxID=2711 RepID=A0ACB8NUJ7_CITSI|nr:hypothetical protein KPL71_001066 [Citrus sinensis]